MQHRKSRSRIVWLCALAVGVSVSCGQAQQDKPLATNGTPAQQSPVDRGQYLATVMDCNGCHTPFKNGEPDMTKRLSGHPESVGVKTPPKLPEGWAVAINDTNTEWAGPWGVSFTANLTSDREHGTGDLDRGDVHQCDSEGKAHGDVAGHPSAHAVAHAGQSDRRRSQGHLRLPADGSANYEPRARGDSAAGTLTPGRSTIVERLLSAATPAASGLVGTGRRDDAVHA